jgi:signal transduction histidine kinase
MGNAKQSHDEEHYRREAMGAFAHEVRTPLTSIRMVMELGRRQAPAGQLALDGELSAMLTSSVDDLQRLADDLQEASRLERGKLALGCGPSDLAAVIAAAAALTAPHVLIEYDAETGIEGPWDAPRLVRAVAGFVESANRMGDGDGRVALTAAPSEHAIELRFVSGEPCDGAMAVSADAGFAFFRSRLFVLAMGGAVECARAQRHATIVVTLPYARQDPAQGGSS